MPRQRSITAWTPATRKKEKQAWREGRWVSRIVTLELKLSFKVSYLSLYIYIYYRKMLQVLVQPSRQWMESSDWLNTCYSLHSQAKPNKSSYLKLPYHICFSTPCTVLCTLHCHNNVYRVSYTCCFTLMSNKWIIMCLWPSSVFPL